MRHSKWWVVPLGVALSAAEQRRTVDLILAWIERQTGREDS